MRKGFKAATTRNMMITNSDISQEAAGRQSSLLLSCSTSTSLSDLNVIRTLAVCLMCCMPSEASQTHPVHIQMRIQSLSLLLLARS